MGERKDAYELILGLLARSREAGLTDRQVAGTINTVLMSEGLLMDASTIEARVGGSYEMSDGRKFWIDSPVAREIARRAVDGPSKGILIRETTQHADGSTRVRTGGGFHETGV